MSNEERITPTYYWGTVHSVKRRGEGYVVGVINRKLVQYFHIIVPFKKGEKVEAHVSLDGKRCELRRVG